MTQKIGSAALQAFFNLCKKLEISSQQERILLGNPPESVFNRWKSNLTTDQLNDDTLDRISYLLGIYKALNILLPSSDAAIRWFKKPNNAPIFSGDTALNRILSGSIADLSNIRRYLDGQHNL